MTQSDTTETDGTEYEGYGLGYSGAGFRCPECEAVGTYLTCSECGYYMNGPDTPRYRGTDTEQSER